MSRGMIYLSGMMDGVSVEDGNRWRIQASDFLKSHDFTFYNPYEGKSPGHKYEPNEVHARDLFYLDRSDIVLVNLDLPASIDNSKIPFFTIGEMYLSHRDRKPIIAYTNCLSERHGYKAIVTKSFTNLEDSLEYINLFY